MIPVLPADSSRWREVVDRAYGLKSWIINAPGLTAHLFRAPVWRRGYATTAPYLTDGGIEKNGVSGTGPDLHSRMREELKRTGLSYILLRSRFPLEGLPARQRNVDGCRFLVDQSFFSFILDLRDGTENLWTQKLNSKTRNQIRKGLRNNLIPNIGGLELLPSFYRVLSRCWRDLGTPIHSVRFFKSILESFGSDAKLIVLALDGEPVSTAILVRCGNTLHHPFAGTIRRYNSICANNVLYWRILEYACTQGVEFFDLGRSGVNQGTFRYKMSWGAQPVALYYNYFLAPGAQPPDLSSRIIQICVEGWKHLPLFVTQHLGPHLIKGVL